MNCPNCNSENTETSKFCIKCGSPLKQQELVYVNNNYSEKLIFIGLSINFLAFIIQFSINNLPIKDNWSVEDWNKFSVLSGIINLIGTILIPIALKNKTLKILGIILALIPICSWMFLGLN
jgi:hypothetical protein